jgi:multiple antibiotic resistance protein
VELDAGQIAQATISVWVLVGPLSRGVFFRLMTEGMTSEQRRKGAIQVVVAVAVILYVSALVGREFLELVGIDLGAFGVAGGLLLTGMGFDMLGNGNTRAQGGERVYDEPQDDDSFIVPFATPFIAGPGAITAVITLSTEGTGWTSIVTVLIAVTIPLVALIFGMLKLGNLELKPTTMKLIGQAGGLFIATIGIQLVLGGIDRYYNG